MPSIGVGARVAETIRTGIINVNLFKDNPALLMLGMVCAVCASSIYLTLATRLGMPVSTTHSIMGGVIGMGIASVGSGGIKWWGGNINSGVVQVFLAWILAPVLSGCFGAIIFLITKYGVMLRKNPVTKAFIAIPIYFGITSALLTSKFLQPILTCCSRSNLSKLVLIVWKGGASRIKLTDPETIGVIFGVGGAVALIVAVFFLPWLYRKVVKNDWKLRWYHVFLGPLLLKRGDMGVAPQEHKAIQDFYRGHMTMEQLQLARAQTESTTSPDEVEAKGEKSSGTAQNPGFNKTGTGSDDDVAATAVATPNNEPEHISIIGPRPKGSNFSPAVLFWQFKRIFFRGIEQDVIGLQKKRNILTGDLETMHAHAAHYDNKAEYMYSFLQVMTAATASFTHGANDVSKYVLKAHSTFDPANRYQCRRTLRYDLLYLVNQPT